MEQENLVKITDSSPAKANIDNAAEQQNEPTSIKTETTKEEQNQSTVKPEPEEKPNHSSSIKTETTKEEPSQSSTSTMAMSVFDEMFASRYTDADEEYIKAGETITSEPICIVPWTKPESRDGPMPPARERRNFDYDRDRRQEDQQQDGDDGRQHHRWNRRNGNNFGGCNDWRGGGNWRGPPRGRGRGFGRQQQWREGDDQRNFERNKRFRPY